MTCRAAWPAVFLMGVLMCVCPDWAPAEDVKPVFQHSANGTRNTRPFCCSGPMGVAVGYEGREARHLSLYG